MATFADSLQRFDQLLDETPDHILQANRDLIKTVCKKLNKSKGSSASSLLEALESSQKKIEEYTQLPIESAIARPVDWAGVDLRVHDIRLGATRHDNTTKFRKGMGERSLAWQYHEWEMREFNCSKLNDLCRDPASHKEKMDGNIAKFIAAHDLPKIACVEKGIQHGTRLLLLENLMGTSGTSAILFFAFGKFRAVNYPEMSDLATSMREEVWIAKLVWKIQPWFEGCCRRYKGETDSRYRKRSTGNGEECEGPEKRRRADYHTPTQATDGGDEPDLTMPSQRTCPASSGSAQVVSVPDHAGYASLNAREEMANNRLQHPEDTTPRCGVPTPARLPAPDPAASGQQIEYVPNLHPQCQSDTDFIRWQEPAAQAACFRLPPNANDPMHANSTKAGGGLNQQRATNYPGSYDQTNYFPADQGYGAVDAGAPAWNDTSYDVQSDEFDPTIWNTIFS